MSTGQAWTESAAGIAEPIGGLWLNALQMTIVPLVVSLIITGIAGAAAAARASRLATRSLILFTCFLLASSILAALLTPALLNLFPLNSESGLSLREALSHTEPPGTAPTFAQFIGSLVPSNPVAAASSNGGVLPLIVFVLVFAFAQLAAASLDFLARLAAHYSLESVAMIDHPRSDAAYSALIRLGGERDSYGVITLIDSSGIVVTGRARKRRARDRAS